MAYINKVILIGTLGRDPEMRTTSTGSSVCSVSLATNRSWTDKNTQVKTNETEWHRVVFYDRLAEIVTQYMTKGRSMYIEGRLKTRKWKDKEGKDLYTTEIIGESMQMLADHGDSNSTAADAPLQPVTSESINAVSPVAPNRPPARRPATAAANKSVGTNFDDMTDDIPF